MNHYHNISEKIENILEFVFINSYEAELAGIQIFKGFCGTIETCPRIEIIVKDGEFERIGSTQTGNVSLHVDIAYVSHMQDTTREVNAQLSAIVEDILMRDDILELINLQAVNDFQALRFFPETFARETDGMQMRTVTTCSMFGKPSREQ